VITDGSSVSYSTPIIRFDCFFEGCYAKYGHCCGAYCGYGVFALELEVEQAAPMIERFVLTHYFLENKQVCEIF